MAFPRDVKISLRQWERAKEVFDIAVDLDPTSRDSYLAETCTDDSVLLDEVKELLEYYDQASSFLRDPASLVTTEQHAPPVFSTGQLVANRFRIMKLIGSGGMGEVYVAYDFELGELVALKTLRAMMSADARMITSFKQEVHLARLVTHPNVCRIFDIFWHHSMDGTTIAVLTMEYLAGETLLNRIQSSGPLVPSEALLIIRQIADGLDAAHRFGIIHRDFKSSNVMLIPQPNGTSRAVVTDFGLASDQYASLESSKESDIAGTPAYIAPEQLQNATLTPAVDIYAFGVVLFEMLNGHLPFRGGPRTLVALKQQQVEPPPQEEFKDEISPLWRSAILQCLSGDPCNRPASASNVSSLLSSGPSWSRSRKLVTGLATVVLLATTFFLFRPHVIDPEAQAALDGARVALENDSKEGFTKAIQDYERATVLDSNWAQPWAELAYAYASASNFRYIDGPTALRRAREAALIAIRLDPGSGKAYGALGWTQSLDFDEWPQAEQSFSKAIQLSPEDGDIHYWFGVHLRKKGRFREAEEQDKLALAETHERDPNVWCELAFLYWTSNQITKFHEHMTEQLKAHPNFALTRYLFARLLKIEHKFAQAEEELSFAEKLGMNPVTVMVERASLAEYEENKLKVHDYIGLLEAEAKVREIDGLLLAGVYVGLNDYDAAFRVLEMAYQRKDNTLLSLATSPVLAPLRPDPRFKDLLKKLHFSDQIMQQMEFNSSSSKDLANQPSRSGTS